jgi:AbrB family looped-hinge helix DNA binding protein
MSVEVTFPTELDSRGSVIIPKKIRETLNIEQGDIVYIRIMSIERKKKEEKP